MVRDHARAEDVTQDVFVAALRRLRATERPIAFKPWIYEIAKNACIDAWRRSSRAEVVSYDEDLGAADHGRLVSGAPAPEALVDTRLELEQLKAAFEGLSDAHHEILVLRELHGYSYEQIAERLGLTRAGVESTLFRARRRLGEEFEELGTGAACRRSRAIIVSAEGRGETGTRDELRLARHVTHCPACRRAAALAGFDLSRLAARKGLRAKIGSLLPLPAWLRRTWTGAEAVRGPVGRVVERAPLVVAGAEPLSHGAGKFAAGVAAAAVVAGVGAGTATQVDSVSGPEAHPRVAAATKAKASHAAAPTTTAGRVHRARPSTGPAPATGGQAARSAAAGGAASQPPGDGHATPAGGRSGSAAASAAHDAVGTVRRATGAVAGAVTRAQQSGVKTPSISTPSAKAGPVRVPSATAPSVTVPSARQVVRNPVGSATGAAGTVRSVAPTATGAVGSVAKPVAGTVRKAVAPVSTAVPKAVAPVTAAVPKAAAPVTAAVPKAVAPVTGAVPKAVAPVTGAVPRAAAPVTGAAPAGTLGGVTGTAGKVLGG
jgi:RNA polymerase sigma factor (sigma-70 family)